MSDSIQLSLDQVLQLARNALTSQGFSAAQAEAIATTVHAAERDGCVSHGLFRIPFYVKALGTPETNAGATPTVTHSDNAIVHVNGHNGFCPLALNTGIDPLIEKARQFGIAALAINNVYNIAALWPEVERVAEQGLVAFAFTAATSTVAPAGGTKPIYGTNPMAFGWPRPGRPPLVFDQASAATARGEIQLHLRAGESIPEGWAIDHHGQPTTDPEAALAGAQLPFGGHKGAAIALMVELLAGALIGDLFSYEATLRDVGKTGAPFGGEFMLAIDPAHFAPGQSIESRFDRAEALFALILEQDGTRLPSDRRIAARQRTRVEGISIPASLHESLLGFTEV